MSSYLEVWKKYAVFSGRARRSEYWLFTLFNTIVLVGLIALGAMLESPRKEGIRMELYFVYAFAAMIPSYAVFVRRLHDTNHSGWWGLLISFIPLVGLIILLICLVRDSDPGKNSYGPNPKRSGEPWEDMDDDYDYERQSRKGATQPWDGEL